MKAKPGEAQYRHRSLKGLTVEPGHLAFLGLEALARYKHSGLAHQGEHMHGELVTRLRQVRNKNAWT